jgi:hypothetical protein
MLRILRPAERIKCALPKYEQRPDLQADVRQFNRIAQFSLGSASSEANKDQLSHVPFPGWFNGLGSTVSFWRSFKPSKKFS